MSLVETDWLNKNFDKVKIVDCSWHMPQTSRTGFEEYKNQHIPNAIFFDLDKNSKKKNQAPSYVGRDRRLGKDTIQNGN
jgi:thiosulfate/3-mercaptopyruvate sulfurtransferase